MYVYLFTFMKFLYHVNTAQICTEKNYTVKLTFAKSKKFCVKNLIHLNTSKMTTT